MPASVHIPRRLLDAVDRKAQALGVSRNGLIVRAIERELAPNAGWTPGFFEALSAVSPATAQAIEALRVQVLSARGSKQPFEL